MRHAKEPNPRMLTFISYQIFTSSMKKRVVGITLPPELAKWAKKRAIDLDMTLSDYIARLIEMDRVRRLIEGGM